MISKEAIQDNQYTDFPYHYLPHVEKGVFRQHRNLFWGYEYLSYTELVVAEIAALKPKTYCDIGCGEGRMLSETRKQLSDISLTGIEYSDTPLLYARAFTQGMDIDFIKADIYTHEPKAQYDVVTLIEVVEHIEPDTLAAFLKATLQYVRPGGTLIITTPCDVQPVQQKHYQHFSFASLRSYLPENVSVTNEAYLTTKNWKTKLIERALGNRFFILNHNTALRWLYRHYTKNYLYATAKNAGRVKLTIEKK